MRACGCVWTLQMSLISLLFGVNYFIITFLHNDVGFFFSFNFLLSNNLKNLVKFQITFRETE